MKRISFGPAFAALLFTWLIVNVAIGAFAGHPPAGLDLTGAELAYVALAGLIRQKLDPFLNVVATGKAVVRFPYLATLNRIVLALGGTTFTRAMITGKEHS